MMMERGSVGAAVGAAGEMAQAEAVEEQSQRRLARYVTAARQAHDWSQAELARRAGISGSLVSDIERAQKKRVAPSTLRQLANALGLDYREVLNAAGYLPALETETPGIVGGERGIVRTWRMASGALIDQFSGLSLTPDEEDELLQDLLDALEIAQRRVARARARASPRGGSAALARPAVDPPAAPAGPDAPPAS